MFSILDLKILYAVTFSTQKSYIFSILDSKSLFSTEKIQF
jgi:hypothetical protein